MTVNEQALIAAYAAYDSDPRVNGPEDAEAFRAGIVAYLAADAAAAPAVGVSDDRNPIDILFEFGSVYHRWIERRVTADDINAATRHALERLGATETLVSLTAQPEPGTGKEQG